MWIHLKDECIQRKESWMNEREEGTKMGNDKLIGEMW